MSRHSMRSRIRPALRGLVRTLVVIALAGAEAASAQPSDDFRPTPAHLEMVRMWRLVDELNIDEQQASVVFPAFNRHQKQRQALVERRQAERNELRKLLAAEASTDESLKKQMAQVRRVDTELLELQQSFQHSLEQVLTVRQQAALMLFEDTFRRDLQNAARRMRGIGQQGPGADRRGPPWTEGR